MRILVDLDGVLADFDRPLWDWAVERGFQFNVESVTAAGRSYFLTENLQEEWQRRLMRRHIDQTDFFRTLPEIDGCVEGLRELADNFDVWLCTKPLESNLVCRDSKAHWVRKRWPDLEHKLIITPDKSLINGDVLLDDAIRPEWAATATWNPVIYRQSYNGAGTKWENWPHWSWSESVEDLLLASLQAKADYL